MSVIAPFQGWGDECGLSPARCTGLSQGAPLGLSSLQRVAGLSQAAPFGAEQSTARCWATTGRPVWAEQSPARCWAITGRPYHLAKWHTLQLTTRYWV